MGHLSQENSEPISNKRIAPDTEPASSEKIDESSSTIHYKQYSKQPWFVTLPVLGLLAFLYIQYAENRGYRGVVTQINVGIHEMGHIFFNIFQNQTLSVLGGTLMQLLVPIFFFVALYRKKLYFWSAICLGWLSTNFFYLAMYAYDATRLQLPLLTMGESHPENVIHDRNYLLDQWGVIQYTDQIAYGFVTVGTLLMALCFLYAGWLIYAREMRSIQ